MKYGTFFSLSCKLGTSLPAFDQCVGNLPAKVQYFFTSSEKIVLVACSTNLMFAITQAEKSKITTVEECVFIKREVISFIKKIQHDQKLEETVRNKTNPDNHFCMESPEERRTWS